MAKQEKEDVAFRRLVEDTAKECGVSFARGAVDYLAAKIGAHPRLGVEETKKMASYLGEEKAEITEELVLELVPDYGREIFLKPPKPFFQVNWNGQSMLSKDIFFTGRMLAHYLQLYRTAIVCSFNFAS